MNKKVLLTIVALLFAFATLQFGILEAVVLLVFLGIVPGTSFVLPAWVMFVLMAIAIAYFTKWVASSQLYPGSPKVKASRAKVLGVKAPAANSSSSKRRAKNAKQKSAYGDITIT